MAIGRSTGALLGTSETVLLAVAAGATSTGAEVDVLADNTSVGEVAAYLVLTGVAVGSVDVRLNPRRVTTQAYQQPNFQVNVATIAGTVKVPLGRFSASRFMTADVKNNDGTNAVSVFVGYELEKYS